MRSGRGYKTRVLLQLVPGQGSSPGTLASKARGRKRGVLPVAFLEHLSFGAGVGIVPTLMLWGWPKPTEMREGP